MFLSRSGFELGEIWASQQQSLAESDEQMRQRQRRAAATGDEQAQRAYHRDLYRAGDHQTLVDAGGGHMLNKGETAAYMQPHIDAYEQARRAHIDTERQHSSGNPNVEGLKQTRKAQDQAAKALDDVAGKFGRAVQRVT